MTLRYRPYETCTACLGRALPGTVALMQYVDLRFPYVTNMGIYNCRNVAGTNTKSTHSCGRSVDVGIPTLSGGGANHALGDPIVRLLGNHAWELGLTEQIYARVRYSESHPRGTSYGGVHPHNNHDHVGQTKWHATNLKMADYERILGPVTGGDDDMETTKGIQRSLNAAGFKGSNGQVLTVDGVWGANTEFAFTNMCKAAKATSGGGQTAAQVDAKIAAHAKVRASAGVHPHVHAEGTTGPAQ